MPKRTPESRNDDVESRRTLIRHHLEEASSHLGMVKQLAPETNDSITKIGKLIKVFYTRYGGHPDA